MLSQPRPFLVLSPVVAGFLLSLVLAAGPLGAQAPIEEVELSEADTLAVDVRAPTIDRTELDRLIAEAETVFEGPDRPAALTLYGRVIDILASEQAAGVQPIDDGGRQLWSRALLRRAQIYHQLGETELAENALGQRFGIDPEAAIDGSTLGVGNIVGDDFARVAERIRLASIGELSLVVDPLDAEIRIDGRLLAAGDPLDGSPPTRAVPPGLHRIEITRPGYQPVQRELEIEAGRRTSIEETLERTSPVLRLATRPSGAEVTLDGQVLGVTSGVADEDFLPQGAIAIYRREEFSDELVIEGIEPGLRRLEVRHPGHRPYRIELQIDQPIDYRMPPIVLERERGQLVFADFPAGAEIRVDGEVVQPDVAGATRPRVSLAPGAYHVTVDSGRGMFSTRLELADRQTMEVRVELRPGLAFLGVLGQDTQSARGLAQSLRLRLGESASWTIIDRSPEAPGLLTRLGLDAERLRSPSAAAEIDWKTVQATVDSELPGLVYALAVLDNDLLATRATLWLWPAAPGPARPDSLTIPLRDPQALTALRHLIERPVPLTTPWLGATVLDTDAEPHPVVAQVMPASPAEKAGLQIGDRILGFAGSAITSRAELAERIAKATAGDTFDLAVQRAAGSQTLRLELGRSPLSLPDDPSLPRTVAWAALHRLANGTGLGSTGTEWSWLVELDRALLLLAGGDAAGAVQVLRGIRAPQTSHGLGQASVDYHLGLALSRLGPELRDAARQSLSRAAGLPGARLDHHDGPFLQPRARARLKMLGERSGG